MKDLIPPHGGKLVSLFAPADKAKELAEEAKRLKSVPLDDRSQSDIEMLAQGGYSPLSGFLTHEEWRGVVTDMRLPDRTLWPIPITLQVSQEIGSSIRPGARVALKDHRNEALAIMTVTDRYAPDRTMEAKEVYRTIDPAHPGVAHVMQENGAVYLGGPVEVIRRPDTIRFPKHHRDPADVRRVFEERGWRTVVAFQTRNPVHRAHEYLQKCALEMVDGLLLHPIVGATKSDDIPAEVRMKCYEVLLEGYYPANRVLLNVLPMPMRYAGPREAVLHAIVRQNYGATHLIIGRDHAGVGNYYGTYDAQDMLRSLPPGEIKLTPIYFENSFFCRICGSMASPKTCPHDESAHLALSGTKVREMLRNGEVPPPEFTRKEVAEILIASMK